MTGKLSQKDLDERLSLVIAELTTIEEKNSDVEDLANDLWIRSVLKEVADAKGSVSARAFCCCKFDGEMRGIRYLCSAEIALVTSI